MRNFTPDYRNIVLSANNIEAKRLPLYEHLISTQHMETVLNKQFSSLVNGNYEDKKEFFKNYCEFFKVMGYDTVSIEFCSGGAYPGAGALGGHVDPIIKTRDDFEKYPFEEVIHNYYRIYAEQLCALREVMPQGMKAIGGVGNGIFEVVQDLVGYMDLCYLSADDPDLYEDLFAKIGDVNLSIWERFMREFGDIYCVLRFGDDLGYKSSTMLNEEDVKRLIIPQYKRIINVVHSYNKPFLLHSCGNIFNVMDDLINVAGINAKHSNEDQIAPFPIWVEKYGDKIGNFGGIDTDAVCRLDKPTMKDYILEVIHKSKGHGGFAFGSGNSIPDYVPLDNYLYMVEIVRQFRGE
ncbi:uroporphyrinogen decarboxylase family protein [Paludicola sp. MB14-C6]|uniref:uroporphyrinogen decarboxylase family protein n=1 Tax=Paludihabitans sp. MB14-C6 TaxID=3070656 RepID=UPI0027DE445E|nr:uroporphyrinogen decarboxylase family protein [Paludicola sp. MB14-C6]WMJ22224.1 uroporphyrinogen decarboxylase family protein [Paludicola sp. MB14-C6]